ncbi:heme NO-binding domain-containing protein [Methylorubrum salsuginis]|uniref:Haem-NO-binding n=1 Tax=Methylorubrum salsuginis TaxID=414703 RepID=A0A1I4KYD1_9HYPH|nr:heme NO-binding domain-containing protein [Methylorubrum salsuginis]SFL83603.1 Haem-NO-binding [Methylorubrum salsuginis]
MKGVVFTEFLDFVSMTLGSDMADDIIDEAAVPSGGAYTAVGTYAHTEMQALIAALSRLTKTPAAELLGQFGRHLCGRFAATYPEFFAAQPNLFEFLGSANGHIHAEVRKLYPDAELPVFRLSRRGADAIELDYESCRPLEALAEGMIRAAADHYRQPVAIATARVAEPGGSFVRFSIRHAA